jgi:hypothetical protein
MSTLISAITSCSNSTWLQTSSSCLPVSNTLPKSVSQELGSVTSTEITLQIVDSVVALNPSYLAKGNSAGTYCKMSIHPQNKERLSRTGEGEEEEVEHEVYERARVDVLRI